MSVTDPLLKSVKYLVQEFHSVGQDVTDTSPYLEQLCTTVEQCFLKGIKTGSWEITKNKESARKKFWSLLRSFETNGPMPYTITAAMNTAVENKRLKTADGKFRYLIRHCLTHRSTHVLVEFLMSKRDGVREWYYEDQTCGRRAMTTMAQFGGGSSIITHEELAEQFRSLLLTCSTSLTFNLNLKNSYFLDDSWQIPVLKAMEFVPTNELGIQMVYIDGFAIVTYLKPGSLAYEERNVGVGDLLVEMNGKILFPALRSGENDAMKVWRQCKKNSLPCQLTVLKPKSPTTGKIFPPLKEIFREYHRWMESHYEEQQQKLDQEISEEENKERSMLFPPRTEEKTPVLEPHAAQEGVGGKFKLQYVGEIATGSDGGVDQIEWVIRQGVKKASERTTLDVEVTITQISIQTKTMNEKQLLFNHKYADIASCGKLISDELHFCYIAGDTFCTISKQFKGYVFRATSTAQAKTILNAVYQGFKRTTWFM